MRVRRDIISSAHGHSYECLPGALNGKDASIRILN